MRSNQQDSIHIELHVPEFDSAKRFYTALGFEVAWESTEPGHGGYLVMKRGGLVFCFWPGNESVTTHPYFSQLEATPTRGFGVEVVCMVDDLAELYALAQRLDGAVVQGLERKPWGRSDFRLADPYGYYVRFTERYDVTDPAYPFDT